MRAFFLGVVLSLLSLPALAIGEPFRIIVGSTISIAATTTAVSGTFVNAPTDNEFQVRVYNACTGVAFIRFGGTATTTQSAPIPSGVVEVFSVPAQTTFASAILASGSTCSVYMTLGSGQ